MRELAILTFVTLDGVMQSPATPDEDPSGGFRRGGWAMPCWDDVMAQVVPEAMTSPYDLLLGRRTYDTFAGHFAHADDPVARQLNRATKYVVTSRPDDLPWSGSVPLTGDVAAEVARLKAEDGPLLQVHGSWQLIQALLVHDLVDEFRLWTFPVLVGAGKRLFGDGLRPGDLRLVKSAPGPSGAVMTIYRRAAGV